MKHRHPLISASVTALSALWVAAVTYASLKAPSMQAPPFFLNFPHSDKMIHFCMYFGMGFWLFMSLYALPMRARWISTLAVSVMYGIFMELMQDYMDIGRSLDYLDMAANTCGAGSFLLLSRRIDAAWQSSLQRIARQFPFPHCLL